MWCERHYEVTVQEEVAKYLHFHIKSRNGDMECNLTVVYGWNTVEQRKDL